MNYYERTYKKIQDIISSIGGVNQVINIIAFYINYYYHNYILLFDTKKLLFSSIKMEKNHHKNISNENKLIKKKIKDLEKVKSDNEYKKRNYDRNKFNENIKNKKNNNKNEKDFSKNIDNNIIKNNTDIDIKKLNEIEKNKYIINKNKKKENTNFFNYIIYNYYCCKKNNPFKVYNDFRIKIISEEHLIKNHLNIYNLLRITEKKRNYKRYSYKLKDLIKLV